MNLLLELGTAGYLRTTGRFDRVSQTNNAAGNSSLVRKEYQWGLDTSASLPYGYVLLKRKKNVSCRTNHRRIPWHNSCKATYRRCFGVETASYHCLGV